METETETENNSGRFKINWLQVKFWSFTIFMVLLASYSAINSRYSEETTVKVVEKIDSLNTKQNQLEENQRYIATEAIEVVLDTNLVKKITKEIVRDLRFYSSDNWFFVNKLRMVNEDDSIIGYPALFTSEDSIHLYFSNKKIPESQFYRNLISGKIRVIDTTKAWKQ